MHSINDSGNSVMQLSTIAPTSYIEPKTTYTTPIASNIDVIYFKLIYFKIEFFFNFLAINASKYT